MNVTLRVVETHTGCPVARMPVRLERQTSDGWLLVSAGQTGADGRMCHAGATQSASIYRLVLDTEQYFTGLGLAPSYPDVTVTLRGVSWRAAWLISVLIAARGYVVFDTDRA